jgi:ComF family protein
MLTRLLAAALRALLPHRCAVCEASTPDYVCTRCASTLPRLAQGCRVCAHPLGAADAGGICGTCLRKPPAFDASHAPLVYSAPVDALIHDLKYRRRLASADFLAARLPTLPAAADTPPVQRVVPVPLSRQRLAHRGYNQAFELARRYAVKHGLALDMELLRRVCHTPAQVGLPWRERSANLRGAFHCSELLNGAHILVVDDVMTSGSTLAEVARTLKAAGAGRVTNLVAARAVRNQA